MNRVNCKYLRAAASLTGLLGLALLLVSTAAQAKLSEPDHLIYGQLTWFGDSITSGEIAIAVEAWPEPVARFTLGSEPALGPQYALRVPMDTLGERVPGTAREGDEAAVLWNGQLVAMAVIGERGTAQRLDLDPEMLSTTPGLVINNIAVGEGAAGTQTPATFTVTLTQPVENTVIFEWVTNDGSAIGAANCIGGADYVANSGIGEIQPGQQQTQLSVMVCGNDQPDGDRHFYVELLNPANATLLSPLGQATILDNDTAPRISINNITVQEPQTGQRAGVFRVSLTEPWTSPVSIDWATANGTAVAGIDYVADSGVLTIPAGAQTGQIQVQVLANPLNQDDRDFFVQLSNPVNGTLLRDRGQALIVDAAQTLAYVETQQDGVSVDGMSDPASIAVASPDGGHVYVASRTADELVVFDRDSGSGALSPHQLIETTGLLGAAGRQVEGISGFAGLTLSADGASVYAVSQANNAVVVFSRNNDSGDAASYGRLSLVQAVFQGDVDATNPAGPADGLQGARGVAVSPDGLNVYVAGAAEGTVAVFRRNPTSGALTYSEVERNGVNNPNDPGLEVQGIGGAFGVAVSPNGQFVYVSGQSSDAIAVFSRDLTTGLAQGRLSFDRHYVNGIGGVSGILSPAGLAFSPDGHHLYVTGQESNSLAVFRRESGGELTWRQAAVAGDGGMQGLESPRAVAVSPDGELVYVASLEDGNATEPGTLAILRRNRNPASPDFGRLTFDEVKRNQVGGVQGLWGATAVAISPDDAHIYVAARWDRAVTVFARDLLGPTNPVIESTTHAIETWHNEAVVTMTWSGAQDLDGAGLPNGSGVRGYSVLFSSDPGSDPGTAIDIAHVQDPHGADSAPLSDGDDHWFHLRTCDFAGNCSDTASVGPYWIDLIPPTGPANLASTSHEAGAPSIPEAVIVMAWDPATDPGTFASGLAGYSYVFNTNPAVGPNDVINLGPGGTTTESDPLPAGTYYFHIRSVDHAGNWSAIATVGPFGVGTDEQPPQVQEVGSVASAPTGQIVDGSQLEGAITRLLVKFSEPMAASGEGDAGHLASYRLFADDGAATDCATAPAPALISGAIYDDFARTTRLQIGNTRGLPAGDYVLMVCDQIRDINGNPLDGDGDGSAGGDFVRRFAVTRGNQLSNPNFDSGTGAWSLSSGAISHDPAADADDQTVSGAAHFEIVAGQAAAHALSQCISVAGDAGTSHSLRARVRMQEVDGGDPSPVSGFASVTFYSAPNCGTGSELAGDVVSNAVFNDTADQWLPLSLQTAPGASAGAVSALVSMNVEFPSSAAFPVRAWFDNTLFFGVSDGVPPSELPQVESVRSTRAYEWDDLGRATLPSERSFTQLVPVFTRGVFSSPGGLDPEAVNNPANYRVLSTGPSGSFSTTDCSAVLGDDVNHLINEVTYNAADKRAVVKLGQPRALQAGRHRLIICGSIRDFDGNYLDGSGQGAAGSDYVLDFELASSNLLANPNLDTTTAHWTLEPAAGGTLERGSADVDGRLSSGSLRVQHQSGPGQLYRAGQCVELGGLRTDLTAGASVFVSQGAGAPPMVAARVRFFDGAGCGGTEVQAFDRAENIGNTAGLWYDLQARVPDVPPAAQSARVTFEVETDPGVDAAFSLWLDHLMLRSGNADLIFRTRFTGEP